MTQGKFQISNYKPVGKVVTTHGVVEVIPLSHGHPLLSSTSFIYAAVVVKPVSLYEGPQLPMIVTVHDPNACPLKTELALSKSEDGSSGGWSGHLREVDSVYADRAFRMRSPGGGSAPVAVGRVLYQAGSFAAHSDIRSEKGTSWASAVGRDIPILRGRPKNSFSSTMKTVLKELNDEWGISSVPKAGP